MKSISGPLATHLGGDSTTLAVLWKLKRLDGTIMGFTTHDQDITYDGTPSDTDGPITYYAATGFTNTATETKADMSVDNLNVTGFLDSTAIVEADVRAGLYDNATIEIRIVNWADLTMGDLKVRKGTTGIIRMSNGVFEAEIRGITQKLTTIIGDLYGPLCRAELGSGAGYFVIDPANHWHCNVNLDLYRQVGSVASSADAVHIIPSSGLLMIGSPTPAVAAPAGWFNSGIITFTSGPLIHYIFEIKSWDGTTLTMYLPLPYQPVSGNTFTIEPGCDKTISDCTNKFQNTVNHRGEPFIPGMDVVLLFPDAK